MEVGLPVAKTMLSNWGFALHRISGSNLESSNMAEPTESQLEKLLSLPKNAPLAALNLFRFRDRAEYQHEDPEYGTSEADVTGAVAFERYTATAESYISKCGGRIVFSAPVDQVMIGAEQPDWDEVAVMFFPARSEFVAMLSDPEFQKLSRHRKAALADHYLLHLNGAPFA